MWQLAAKSISIFHLEPVVLLIHLDSGVGCRVVELSALESSAFSQT